MGIVINVILVSLISILSNSVFGQGTEMVLTWDLHVTAWRSGVNNKEVKCRITCKDLVFDTPDTITQIKEDIVSIKVELIELRKPMVYKFDLNNKKNSKTITHDAKLMARLCAIRQKNINRSRFIQAYIEKVYSKIEFSVQ